MALTVNDWIWTRLSARYGVTPAQQQVGDVFKRWLDERGGSWGFALSDFYLAAVPSATNYGDAEFAYWSGGALAQSVVWLDAFSAQSGSQTAVNLGETGSVYSARYGSATGVDTNDPLLVPHTGMNYLRLVGDANNYASTASSAALNITGDMEVVCLAYLDDWTPAADNNFGGRISGDPNNAWRFAVSPLGFFRFNFYPLGTAASVIGAVSTVAPTITDGSWLWVKVTLDVDNGAGGNTVTFYTAPFTGSAVEPDLSAFTQLGAPVVNAGVTSLPSVTSNLGIGLASGLGLNGGIARFIIRNGISGTVAFDANFATGITSGAQTGFAESSVNAATVTITRATAGRKAVAVVRPVWLFGTDDYMEVAADPNTAYARIDNLAAYVQAAYTTYDTGTATAGAASTLDDTTKAWTASLYIGRAVRITGGTGAGQVRIITANTATQLTISGTWTTTPDATSTYVIESRGNVNGDIEFSARVALDNWASGQNQPIISKRITGQYSYQLYMSAGGVIGLTWTLDGSTTSTIGSAVVPFTNGATYWIRVRRTAATGAWQVDYAADSPTEPTSWTTLNSSPSGTAGTIWQGSASINIGTSQGGSPIGKIYTVIVRDGFAGNAVVYWQASGHPTAANYVNANRVLWTLGGGATIVNANQLNFSNSSSFTVVSVQRTWATPTTSGTIISKWGGGAGWNVRNGFGTPTQPLIAVSDGVNSQAFADPIPTLGALTVLTHVVEPAQVTTYTNTTAFGPTARTVFDSTASEYPVRIGVTPAGGSYNDFELVAVAVIPKALTAADVTAICKLYGTA